MQVRKDFFSEEKKQKTFVSWFCAQMNVGAVGAACSPPEVRTV
jgi:hypothetical protein